MDEKQLSDDETMESDLMFPTISLKDTNDSGNLDSSNDPQQNHQNSEDDIETLINLDSNYPDNSNTQNAISEPSLESRISSFSPENFSDLSKFIIPDQEQAPTTLHEIRTLNSNRKELLKTSLVFISERILKMKQKLNILVFSRSNQMKIIEEIYLKIPRYKRQGLSEQRYDIAKHIIYHKKIAKLFHIQSQYLQKQISRLYLVYDYLSSYIVDSFENTNYQLIIPRFNIPKYFQAFQPPFEKIRKVQHQILIFLSNLSVISPLPPEQTEPLISPQTGEGRIILKFEERFDQLQYKDLNNIKINFEKRGFNGKIVEQFLFDIAWQHQPYPFSSITDNSTNSSFQNIQNILSEIVPLIFVSSDLVEKEYALTPLSHLSNADWVYKNVNICLFEMIVQTSPFEGAEAFFRAVQETSNAITKLKVFAGQSEDEIEIDFDSLFPALVLCIVIFGIQEWTNYALYLLSFSENVKTPEQQFAMTYLEGLVTECLALDADSLKQKMIQLSEN